LTPYVAYVLDVFVEKMILGNEVDQNELRDYILFALRYGSDCSSWGLCDSLFHLGQCVSNPSVDLELTYSHSVNLHQQGKTMEAVHILTRFHENLKGELKTATNKAPVLTKISVVANRLAQFYFYHDRFDQSKRILQENIAMSPNPSDEVVFQLSMVLSELAFLYPEQKAEQTDYEKKLLSKKYPKLLFSRSKHLLTTDVTWKFDKKTDTGTATVFLLVCRALPCRKEGEVDDETTATRKLSNFYITIQTNGPKTSAPRSISHYKFDVPVELPRKFFEDQSWSKLTINIYENQSKKVLLGVHQQFLCYHQPK